MEKFSLCCSYETWTTSWREVYRIFFSSFLEKHQNTVGPFYNDVAGGQASLEAIEDFVSPAVNVWFEGT